MNALPLPLAALVAALLLAPPSYSQPAPDFPAVDPATQKSRDNTRRQILEGELATEQDLLAKAQQALTAAQATKQAADKLGALQEALDRHQSNVAALKQELGGIGRAPAVARAKSTGPVVLRVAQPQEAVQEPTPYWDVYRRPRPSKQQAQPSQKSVSSPLTNAQTQGMSN